MLRVLPFQQLEQRELRSDLVSALDKGQTIVYPTDTIYGIGCRADHNHACRLIDQMKNRPLGQVYSVALGSLAMLEPMIQLQEDKELRLLESILPGPYTLVIRLKNSYRIPANQYRETLGIRIPKLPLLQQFITELSVPLVTTSVNRSGEALLNVPAAIMEQFPGVDILLEAGTLRDTLPSTLLDISNGQPYIIRRRGAGYHQLIEILDKLGLSWSPL